MARCDASSTVGPLHPRWVKRKPPVVSNAGRVPGARIVTVSDTPRESRVRMRGCGQRGQRRVGRMDLQPQAAREGKSEAVAAGRGDGQPSRGQDHRRRVERWRAVEQHPPAGGALVREGQHVDHPGSEPEPGVRLADPVHQPVADVPRPVARGEELSRFGLELERHPELVLEEGALFGEGPGREELPERVRRGVGHVAPRLHHRRKDVAAPAAADQDLASTVGRPFEQDHGRTGAGSEERGHESCRSGADHDHGGRRKGSHGANDRGPRSRNTSRRGRSVAVPLATARASGEFPTSNPKSDRETEARSTRCSR